MCVASTKFAFSKRISGNDGFISERKLGVEARRTSHPCVFWRRGTEISMDHDGDGQISVPLERMGKEQVELVEEAEETNDPFKVFKVLE